MNNYFRIERMADDLSVGWVAELKTRVMVLLQTLQGWYLKVTIKWTCGMKGKMLKGQICASGKAFTFVVLASWMPIFGKRY